MIKETCFGIIPLKRKGRDWEVLLIKHNKGHWSFPKGHPAPGETSREAAERELLEETNLKVVNLLQDDPLIEHYFFQKDGKTVDKAVTYFLAEVAGDVHLLQEEVCDFRWLSFDEALQLITFEEARRICLEAQRHATSQEKF